MATTVVVRETLKNIQNFHDIQRPPPSVKDLKLRSTVQPPPPTKAAKKPTKQLRKKEDKKASPPAKVVLVLHQEPQQQAQRQQQPIVVPQPVKEEKPCEVDTGAPKGMSVSLKTRKHICTLTWITCPAD